MAANILNLSEYPVITVHETEHDYHIYTETSHSPDICQACSSFEIVGYGRIEQLVKDLPVHGKRVGVYINARRFKCKQCGKTFMEDLPGVNSKRMMTDRLVSYIGKQSLGRTFAGIAGDVGIAESTVRNIFRDYINELEQTVRFEIPQWMGIDEVHIIRKPRAVISNIQHKTIVNILIDRNKKTVAKYLSRLEGKEEVRYVAMDMWNPYRDAVKSVLPNARIVIDKFHVVRMANEAMEKVRKSLRGSLLPKQKRTLMHDRFILLKRKKDLNTQESLLLSTWLGIHEELKTAYTLKESFYDIWESKIKDDALKSYKAWVNNITPDMQSAFKPITTAVSNWQEEIFAYFDHPITNAYTESLNNLIKVMNRLGRGYSFEALRARILYTEGIQKIRRLHFNRQSHYGLMTICQTPTVNYGVDIYTLTRLIETGKF